MQDSIYHMTLKSHFISKFALKGHDFAIRKRDVLWTSTHNDVICIFNPLVDYRFKCMALLHSQMRRHMIKNLHQDVI